MNLVAEIESYLKSLAQPEIAEHSQRFFKTGKGQYGYGDLFLGIRVPVIRQTLKKFRQTSVEQAETLLQSPYHEIRLFALLHWVYLYQTGSESVQSRVYQALIKNRRQVNNWDLVDTSVPHIVGAYLFSHPEQQRVLEGWIQSENLWDRRVAILATFTFIRQGQFDWTLKLTEACLQDQEDLMHKAVGWMLREVGKQNENVLLDFLRRHYQAMPRTMLRYAIEKLPESLRQDFLKGRI